MRGKCQAARGNPLPDVGPLTKDEKAIGTIGTNKRGGNTSYTLRRLARDNPEAKQQDIAKNRSIRDYRG
jgi:hypothetical protein